MRSFGVWLWEEGDASDEATRLREVATSLGPKWPISSGQRADYERVINAEVDEPGRSLPLDALSKLWPSYTNSVDGHINPHKSKWQSAIDWLGSNMAPISIIFGSIILLLMLLRSFNVSFLEEIARLEVARGLITFLFAIATVGIAVVVVLATFLSREAKEEADARFQRGKDVLTILIGVFGAILGFYFGSPDGRPAMVPIASVTGSGNVTTVPDAPVPDVPVPDAPVPDAPVPDAPVPDGPAPDGPVPDGPAPDGPVPDGPAPDGPAQ